MQRFWSFFNRVLRKPTLALGSACAIALLLGVIPVHSSEQQNALFEVAPLAAGVVPAAESVQPDVPSPIPEWMDLEAGSSIDDDSKGFVDLAAPAMSPLAVLALNRLRVGAPVRRAEELLRPPRG